MGSGLFVLAPDSNKEPASVQCIADSMMRDRIATFSAIVLTALALVPAGAHVLALANKIGLDRDAYFLVQSIYYGWALLGAVTFAAIIANAVCMILLWRRGASFWLSLSATLLIAIGLGIFFIWTQPANLQTQNWTMPPSDWETLRRQWEYSHAANAILTFTAFCCATAAGIAQPRRLNSA
jgi:hypothetical protein